MRKRKYHKHVWGNLTTCEQGKIKRGKICEVPECGKEMITDGGFLVNYAYFTTGLGFLTAGEKREE